MDGFVLGLFLLAAFIGGFASGLAGFAMGFIVSGIWLHLISPIQTTALIAGYGLCTQGYGVWKLRHSLNWRNVAPFIIAGTISIPVGTLLLTYIEAANAAAGGDRVCRPALNFKDARLSPIQPPMLERRWSATVTVDASRCASTAGYFEVGFSRMKENSTELEFREQFIWSVPFVMIGVDFWADEAVETYWIDSIQACPCAQDGPRSGQR